MKVKAAIKKHVFTRVDKKVTGKWVMEMDKNFIEKPNLSFCKYFVTCSALVKWLE